MIPRLVASDEERRRRELRPARERFAVGLFQERGVLAFAGAVEPADRAAFKAAARGRVRAAGDEEPVALEMAGALAGTALWANPLVLPILTRLLGADCVLGAFGLLAKAEARRRLAPLYPGVDEASLPCYAVRVLIPLDGDELFLADYRQAWSPPVPALELVYCRPWFLDCETWRDRPSLVMPALEYRRAPLEHRELLSRIGSALAQAG